MDHDNDNQDELAEKVAVGDKGRRPRRTHKTEKLQIRCKPSTLAAFLEFAMAHPSHDEALRVLLETYHWSPDR